MSTSYRYHPSQRRSSIARKEHFYARAHNNFLDAVVILWCKIFADKKGQALQLQHRQRRGKIQD
jgi:hypothetical protein